MICVWIRATALVSMRAVSGDHAGQQPRSEERRRMRGTGPAAFANILALVLLVGGARSSPAAELSFAPHVDISIEPSDCMPGLDCPDAPWALVTGDFNGDHKQDLATANNFSDDVAVLLGDGNGGLTLKGLFPTGGAPSEVSGPSDIAAGLVNSDDILDLVVTNEIANSVSVLIGNGDGTFQAAENYDTGGSPEAVALADLNDDDKLDIATADLFGDTIEDAEDDSVSILFGNGDGTFMPRVKVTVPGGPAGIAAGNLDGAGLPDLAVSLSDRDQVVVLLNDGGTFSAQTPMDVGQVPLRLLVADLDEMSTDDIAVVDEFDDSVSVLLGAGGGTFAPAQSYDVGGFPEAIAAGDVDGDHIVDLVTADSFGTIDFADGSASVLLGRGDGTFAAAQSFAVGTSPNGVGLADFDGNRSLDIATANADSNDVSLLLNTGGGTPCVGDCDGNRKVEINELVTGVNIALGSTSVDACPSFDADDSGEVEINELVTAVDNALNGCGA
jgi:hypothetical protein